MSEEDLVNIANSINECLDKVYAPAAGPILRLSEKHLHVLQPVPPNYCIEFNTSACLLLVISNAG